jgi:uncharacterized protein YkwD
MTFVLGVPSFLRSLPPLLLAALLIGMPPTLLGQVKEELELDDPPRKDAPAAAPSSADISAAVGRIAKRTNQFRIGKGLSALQPDEKLNATAQDFADFMARTGKYGHLANGQRPSERAVDHGYEYCIVAENIAYRFRSTGFTTEQLAKQFFTGWKNSDEHRKNMLDPDVTEFGLAVSRQDGSPTYFAVQLFGRPKSKAIRFQVRNELDAAVKYTVNRRGEDKTFSLPGRATRIHQRCRPTRLSLTDSDTAVQVEHETEYAVVRSKDGKRQLVRRK